MSDINSPRLFHAPEELVPALEAVLFAAGDPVSEKDLCNMLSIDSESLSEIISRLSHSLEEHGVMLHRVAGGWQLATRSEFYRDVSKLAETAERRLSSPTLETLSIIAFRQPVTKQEVERIRGVRAERALRKLLDLELIEEAGRKAVIGRPILYKTTDTFLKTFGLDSLEDLPALPEIEKPEDVAEQLELPIYDIGSDGMKPPEQVSSEEK